MKTARPPSMPEGRAPGVTLSNARAPDSSLSEQGRRRLHAHRFEPLFVADWDRAVFLHFSVAADLLQPSVPFPLDRRDGHAWLSLVAFTMRGMRPRAAGWVGRWLSAPIATHGFLNARTYVRSGNTDDEPGIHFLTEWLPNRLAVALGPPVFGLPYRLGELDYHHAPETGQPISGAVHGAHGHRLRYRADPGSSPALGPCPGGSLDEFLLERYTAFVRWPGGRLGYFRIWHPPWEQTRIEAEISARDLMREIPGFERWGATASFQLAHYTPGAADVAMGRPHRLIPPIAN